MNLSMDEKEIVGYLVNIVTPLFIALFQQPTWSDRKRALVSIAISMALIFAWWLYMWISEASAGAITLTPSVMLQLARMLGLGVLITLTAYRTIWKPTGAAPTIEAATSPDSPAKTRLEAETRKSTSDK